jgi:hypothetical protein
MAALARGAQAPHKKPPPRDAERGEGNEAEKKQRLPRGHRPPVERL